MLRSRFPLVSHPLSRLPLALILLLGLVVIGGCQNNTGNSSEQNDSAASPSASPSGSAAAAPEVVVVRGLTQGDRACYMKLENAQGEISEQEASFELCEQEQLVGQRVQLTRKSTPILAMSCQGDPECTDQDIVDLIVAAEVLP